MRVVINKCLCNGSGICESICCQLCSNYKDKKKIDEEIFSEEFELSARKAARYCPAGAISIER
jgi:ferredoxin